MCDSPDEFVSWASSGILKVVDREKDDDLRERKINHLEMMAKDIAGEVADREASDDPANWRTVMLEMALRGQRELESELGCVALSTIHRSKGLEWDKVFIAGASDGLFPMDNRGGDDEDAGFVHHEEERRIAYVGLTRARKECTFLHADSYKFAGTTGDEKVYEPSSFLAEMGVSFSPLVSKSDQDEFDTVQSFDINKVKNFLRAGM